MRRRRPWSFFSLRACPPAHTLFKWRARFGDCIVKMMENTKESFPLKSTCAGEGDSISFRSQQAATVVKGWARWEVGFWVTNFMNTCSRFRKLDFSPCSFLQWNQKMLKLETHKEFPSTEWWKAISSRDDQSFLPDLCARRCWSGETER